MSQIGVTAAETTTCWVVDRKIGLGLIVTILVYSMGIGAWVGLQNARLARLEDRMAREDAVYERVIRMEEGLKRVDANLKHLLSLQAAGDER